MLAGGSCVGPQIAAPLASCPHGRQRLFLFLFYAVLSLYLFLFDVTRLSDLQIDATGLVPRTIRSLLRDRYVDE